MARRRREISFPLCFVLRLYLVFVFSGGFFTTINICKEYERKLTAFDGGVSVRFKRWPHFDAIAAKSLLSPRSKDSRTFARSSLTLPSSSSIVFGPYKRGGAPISLSKEATLGFKSRLLWNREREQCFIIFLNQTSSTKLSLDRATESLHQSNGILGQTSEQYLDDTSNDSRSGPSTPHLVMPSTLTPASTQHLLLPSTMTPADPTELERPSMGNFSTYGENNNKPLPRRTAIAGKRPARYKKLIMKMVSFPAMSSSTPILDPPTHNRRFWTTTTSRSSTRKLGFHLVGLFIKRGPSLMFWPNTKNSGFKSETTRPRFIPSKQLPNLVEDWKKSQVDSKKILAQPHQSLKSMSFSFFPRSKISFVDDLAKKAVRSMTTGLSMFL